MRAAWNAIPVGTTFNVFIDAPIVRASSCSELHRQIHLVTEQQLIMLRQTTTLTCSCLSPRTLIPKGKVVPMRTMYSLCRIRMANGAFSMRTVQQCKRTPRSMYSQVIRIHQHKLAPIASTQISPINHVDRRHSVLLQQCC